MAAERVAIVTGGAQGIGLGIASRLVAEGWQVVIADIDPEAGAEALEALPAATYVETDVSDEASVARLCKTVGRTFAGLDGLVNNAGISTPLHGPVESLSREAWDRVLSVNLTGPFLMSKHAIPLLRKRHGAIVNITSVRAFQSEPANEAYVASKGGLASLTHALALSLAPEIRVNAIAPGWIEVGDFQKRSRRRPVRLSAADHAEQPVGRVGVPEDVAGLVHYLLGKDASFMTGETISLDGGVRKKLGYLS